MMNIMRHFKDLGNDGKMAKWYDKNMREHRMSEMREYAEEVARRIKNGSTVLEIAPGPGYLSIELAKLGDYEIVGLDISKDFVEIAARNARASGVNVVFRQGNVVDIPFPDESFDFIVCSAAFKNFKEPLRALTEMCRVLKSHGKALIIDLDRDISNREIHKFTKEMGVKGIEALFMEMTFKYFLRRGAYTRNGFIKYLTATPFKGYDIKKEGLTLHVYLQKLSSTGSVEIYETIS